MITKRFTFLFVFVGEKGKESCLTPGINPSLSNKLTSRVLVSTVHGRFNVSILIYAAWLHALLDWVWKILLDIPTWMPRPSVKVSRNPPTP